MLNETEGGSDGWRVTIKRMAMIDGAYKPGSARQLLTTDYSACRYTWVGLPDGRSVAFFVNLETGLIVVDLVDADEKGGIEISRNA